MRHRSDMCCDGTQRLMGEREREGGGGGKRYTLSCDIKYELF